MAELTCPKCGSKYYGVGCPNCDWPAAQPDPGLAKRNRIIGWFACAWGLFLASNYFFHFLSYHNFLMLVAGSMLALAGLQIAAAGRLYKLESRPSSFVCALMFAGFAYLCLYAALSDAPVSGPLPLLPPKWNEKIGKFVFGVVGCVWGWVSLWLFYRTVKPKPSLKPAAPGGN